MGLDLRIRKLERQLSIEESPDTRLKLARCYLRGGFQSAAAEQYQGVLEENPKLSSEFTDTLFYLIKENKLVLPIYLTFKIYVHYIKDRNRDLPYKKINNRLFYYPGKDYNLLVSWSENKRKPELHLGLSGKGCSFSKVYVRRRGYEIYDYHNLATPLRDPLKKKHQRIRSDILKLLNKHPSVSVEYYVKRFRSLNRYRRIAQ